MIWDNMSELFEPKERDICKKFAFVGDALYLMLVDGLKVGAGTHITEDDIVGGYPIGGDEEQVSWRRR